MIRNTQKYRRHSFPEAQFKTKMIKLMITELIIFALASGADWRIIGGKESSLGQHPWQVAVLYSPDLRSVKNVCGGALIDASTVITAAHCFDDNEDPKHYLITSGQLSLKGKLKKETTSGISKIVLHEDRFLDPDGYDIAIMKLKKALPLDEYTNVINIPTSTTDRAKLNDTCYVSGWGATTPEQRRLSTGALLYTDLKIRSNAYCDRVYTKSRIQTEHVCAGGYENNKNACKGDSGSPLVCKRKDHWILEGVLSFGQRICGKYGIPTVYTSIAYYHDWIQSNRN